jgi:hypothetical protein
MTSIGFTDLGIRIEGENEEDIIGLGIKTMRNKQTYGYNDCGFLCNLSAKEVAEKILIGIKMKEAMRRKRIKNSMKYEWDRIADLAESFYGSLI